MARFPLLSPLAAVLVLALAGAGLAQTITMTIPPDPAHRLISVKVTPGLKSTARLPSPTLRAARKRLIDKKDVTPEELRALADHWDGLAALHYTRLLVQEGDFASASDIAYYGTIAVSTGRVWVLPDVVAALGTLDPLTEPAARRKAYAAMLYPHAWAGNSLALDAMIDLNGEGKLFGPMSETTRKRLLDQAQKAGDGRIPLRLALVLMQKPDRTDAEADQARSYLKLANAMGNLTVQTTAANLIALLDQGEAPVVVAKE